MMPKPDGLAAKVSWDVSETEISSSEVSSDLVESNEINKSAPAIGSGAIVVPLLPQVRFRSNSDEPQDFDSVSSVEPDRRSSESLKIRVVSETPAREFISPVEVEPTPNGTHSGSFSSASQTSENHVAGSRFKQLASLAAVTSWWVRKRAKTRASEELSEELRMRVKLQYHFMTPFQKFKQGRRPWKLGIQILKIVIVTSQVLLFGADRFASVAFFQHTGSTFKNMFVSGYDGTVGFSYFSRQDVIMAIQYASSQYQVVTQDTVGKFWYANFSSSDPPPMKFCYERIIVENDTVALHEAHEKSGVHSYCFDVDENFNITKELESRDFFDKIISMELHFILNSIYLNGVRFHHKPDCYEHNNMIRMDNSKHDGRIRVRHSMTNLLLKRCPHDFKISEEGNTTLKLLIVFDVVVILTCLLSAILCLRSMIKTFTLAEIAKRYFRDHKNEELTKWDLFQLLNKWFPVILISDLMAVTGSIYKIQVDERDLRYYNMSSLLLGIAVLLVWIGILRFFTYFKTYNMLLITLRAAAPHLFRFCLCALFVFLGFTFCGWVVLGAYHPKFRSWLMTSECLFSLLCGDDMFPTFQRMSTQSTMIWVFSKIYIYIFVSLFIYLVLSTFISIVGDSYERLKDWGRMPPTKIEQFIEGRTFGPQAPARPGTCLRCLREAEMPANFLNREGSGLDPVLSHLRRSSLSDSRVSIVSASLE